eukprot:2345996-Rhodomonas_salina.1
MTHTVTVSPWSQPDSRQSRVTVMIAPRALPVCQCGQWQCRVTVMKTRNTGILAMRSSIAKLFTSVKISRSVGDKQNTGRSNPQGPSSNHITENLLCGTLLEFLHWNISACSLRARR